MDCTECGENPGEKTRVIYTNSKSEYLYLCDDCREQFEDGELIQSISVVKE